MTETGQMPLSAADKLAALCQEFARRLPDKIRAIELQVQQLVADSRNDDGLRLLEQLAHQLAGSGKTFGYGEVSRCAHMIEVEAAALLKSGQPVTRECVERFSASIALLRKAAASPDTPSANSPKTAGVRQERLVYVVDDDAQVLAHTEALLAAEGYSVRGFSMPAAMSAVLADAPPDAIIMDVMFPGSDTDGITAVSALRKADGKRIPVIFMSARADTDARVRAVRAGGDAYLVKPLDAATLAHTLSELCDRRARDSQRVLIIDDDVLIAQHYATLLQQEGMLTRVVNHPLRAIEQIMEFHPHLVLLDLNMPECNGIELTLALRQERSLTNLPIVFISSQSDEGTRQAALRAGGSGYLSKPVTGKALLEAVGRYLKQSRRVTDWAAQLARLDPLTGLVNYQSFIADLDVVVASAISGNLKRSLIYLAIENIESLREQAGLAGLSDVCRHVGKVIQRQLGSMDKASHLSAEMFGILVTGRSLEDTRSLATRICNALVATPFVRDDIRIVLAASAGAVAIDADSRSSEEVLDRAQQAARAAAPGDAQAAVIDVSRPKTATTPLNTTDVRNVVLDAVRDRSFTLVFQPILNTRNSGEQLYEVRVRVRSLSGRAIPATQLFQVAAKNGQTLDVDRWVIEHAVTALSMDPRARHDASFFIKISGESLVNRMLVPFISTSLSNSKVKRRSAIYLELNESDLVASYGEASEFLAGARALGCGFLLDHFGSTRHSVQVLNSLKPDFVKIQSTLVNRVHDDAAIRSRLEFLVKTAITAGARVMVGAIEDPAVIATLGGWGVHYVQGNLIQIPGDVFQQRFEPELLAAHARAV